MAIFSPEIAYASVDSFVADLNRLIVNPLIGFIFAVAFVYFLFGIFQFIQNADNDEKRTEGKGHMMYGLIGMAVMMGVFGILAILLRTFNINDVNPQTGEVELRDYNPVFPPNR